MSKRIIVKFVGERIITFHDNVEFEMAVKAALNKNLDEILNRSEHIEIEDNVETYQFPYDNTDGPSIWVYSGEELVWTDGKNTSPIPTFLGTRSKEDAEAIKSWLEEQLTIITGLLSTINKQYNG